MQVARLLFDRAHAAATGVCLVVLPDPRTGAARVELYRGWVHAVDAAPARPLLPSVPPRGEDALAALLRLAGAQAHFDADLPREKRGACPPFHPAALVRNLFESAHVDPAPFRARVADGTLQLAATPHPSCLGRDERPLVAFLARPRTLAEIDAGQLCPPQRALRLCLFLDWAGLLRLPAAHASAWALLGLPDGASAEAVRRAYHRLAYELHPDRHPTASDDDRRRLELRFAEVNAAYRQLV